MMVGRKYDLEKRLIDFSLLVISVSETMMKNQAGLYLSNQIIRSGMAPALNYGEAQSAESASDFVHKMKIGLKELRETYVALQIIKAKPLTKNSEILERCISECNEIIAIFVKSIQTAEKNRKVRN